MTTMDKPLYVPYKAVAHVTDGTPFVINRLGNDLFLTASIGSSFQVFRADHLNVCMVSRPLDGTITAMQVLRHDTFVAVGNDIVVFKRNRVVRTYREHESSLAGLLLVGSTLMSYDADNVVNIIDVKERKVIGRLDVLQTASISCIVHPATYLNKVLIGFSNGVLELWNIRSRRLVYTFHPLSDGSNAAVACIEQSPACDVVAVGFSNGGILLLNLKLDKVLFSFKQKGAVTSLSFRTDASAYTGVSPYLVSSSSLGEMHVWRLGTKEGEGEGDALSRRGLVCSVSDAHAASIGRVHFLEGEPVLISAASDNSIKMWIFDQPDGHAPRLLRSREGHIAPPQRIRYYGSGGFGSTSASLRDASDGYSCEMISCGSGGDIRLINTARESQNREMSQKVILKKLGYDRRRALLPPAIDVDFSEGREKDWGNMVSIHKNHSNAYTWKYRSRTVTDFVLRQPSWKSNDAMHPDEPAHHASAVTVSACGNYCVVGNKGGTIHRYNLQSGKPRGSYPTSSAAQGMKSAVRNKRLATPGNVLNASRSILGAPDETNVTGYLASSLKKKQEQNAGRGKNSSTVLTVGRVEKTQVGSIITGLFIDAMNEIMVSSSNDSEGLLMFWDFENHSILGSVAVGSPIESMVGYRDGGFVAALCENGEVRVYDVLTRRLSRVFSKGHSSTITGASFTPNGRRFLTSSLDGTVRVWDMLTARCLSWVSLGHPITSAALSPSAQFLAVTFEGKQGVYLYADRSLFETVHFWKEPTTPSPVNVSGVVADATQTQPERSNDENDSDSDDSSNGDVRPTDVEDAEEPEVVEEENTAQRGLAAITLSAIPRAYWTTLFNMEAVKARNKPIAAPTAPEKAPFFLPTIHREGSAAPSFLSPSEYEKVKVTESTQSEKEMASGDLKRKRAGEDDEENPSKVAATIASMGSAWEDDGDDVNGFGEVSDGDDWDDDDIIENEQVERFMGTSRILKSKNMAKENVVLLRCKLAQSLMSEYPDILNMSITGAQEQSEQFSYDNECVISLLKSLSPPAVDLEMRALHQHDEDAEGADLLKRMMLCLARELTTGRNFEVIQAYLCRFLMIYSDTILKIPSLASELLALQELHAVSCASFRSLVQSNLCLLKVMANLPIA